MRHAAERPGARRAAEIAAAVLASALGAWLVQSGGTKTALSVVVGLAVIAAVLRWPALTLLSLLAVCQELDPSQAFGGPGGSGLLFLGHQIYFTNVARFSLLTVLLILIAARASLSVRDSQPRRLAVGLVVGLGAFYVMRVWLGGSSITSAINQNARFAIVFGAAFVVGASAAHSEDWDRRAVAVFVSVMTFMALIGAYLRATGQGETTTGPGLIFYDAAMGAMAGAAVLAVVSTPAAKRNRALWLLGAAALVVVVLSARRDIWAAMAVALILGLAFSRNRLRLVLQLVSATVVALVALAVFFPAAMTGLGHQLSAIWEATQGTAADSSVRGHLSDVSTGWHAVLASPLSGIGPNAHLPGLVVEGTGQLYIHNQLLESWLRFGLLAAVLVLAVQVVLVIQALRVLRQPDVDYPLRWGAYLLLLAPTAMLTAPFLTQTQRWPAVLGLAAGLVGASLGPREPGRRGLWLRAPTRGLGRRASWR